MTHPQPTGKLDQEEITTMMDVHSPEQTLNLGLTDVAAREVEKTILGVAETEPRQKRFYRLSFGRGYRAIWALWIHK